MYNKFAQYYDELMDDVEYKKWYLYIEEILKRKMSMGKMYWRWPVEQGI